MEHSRSDTCAHCGYFCIKTRLKGLPLDSGAKYIFFLFANTKPLLFCEEKM